jgi:D-galactonate transporter
MFSRFRWMMAGLLFLAGMINYLDRSALSVAAPLITKDLGLEPAALGIVFSAFSFGYAPFCFVGGWASDRFGPRNVFLVSMTIWSFFCGLTAAAYTIPFLLVVRVAFGMAEGPFSSTIAKLVSSWFPKKEAATAIGISNAGTPLGGALSGPIVGIMATAFGWRLSFVLIASISFVWVAAWYFIGRSRPEESPRVSAGELAEIRAGQPEEAQAEAKMPLGFYLKQPSVLSTALAFFGYSYLLFFFLSWFPTYLSTAQHLSIKDLGFVTAIPWTIGFGGLLLSGFVCDYLFKITGKALFSSKAVLVGGLLTAALCVALAGQVETVTAAVALMATSVFAMYMTGTTYWKIILDSVEKPRVGGVAGFVHFIANCAGFLAPLVTGFLVQGTGSFTAAFVFAGAFAIIGAIAVAIFVKPIAGVIGDDALPAAAPAE